MNSHTTEQLLMCEKADLVKYIEELRGDVEGWTNSTSYDNPEDIANELDRLGEIEDCIWCDLWGYDSVEDDTKLYRLQDEFKKLKKLKEENEKLKGADSPAYVYLMNQNEELKKENNELKSSIESISNEYMSGEETIDDIRDYIEQKTDEIVELREEVEGLKASTEHFCEQSQKKSNVITKTLDAIVKTCDIKPNTTAMSMIKSIHAHDELYKIVSYNLTGFKELKETKDKEIKSLKSFRNHYKSSYEDEKRKNDGLKLNIEELKKCNTYYRCYLAFADPKCEVVPDKEHIDEFAGDDEEVKKSLYEDFCIEEEEEEDSYLDGKKIVDTGTEIHGHN